MRGFCGEGQGQSHRSLQSRSSVQWRQKSRCCEPLDFLSPLQSVAMTCVIQELGQASLEGLWSVERDWMIFSMFINTFWDVGLTVYMNIKLWTAGQVHWSTRRTFLQVPGHRGLPIACQWRVWFLKQYFGNVSYANSKPKKSLIYKIIHWNLNTVIIIQEFWSTLWTEILENDPKLSFPSLSPSNSSSQSASVRGCLILGGSCEYSSLSRHVDI